jgi:hypothetical protein
LRSHKRSGAQRTSRESAGYDDIFDIAILDRVAGTMNTWRRSGAYIIRLGRAAQ